MEIKDMLGDNYEYILKLEIGWRVNLCLILIESVVWRKEKVKES